MIYLGFILDYILSFFNPIKTYFIINNLDKNDLFSVIVCGIILDFLYHKIIFKKIKFKKKYNVIKNILLYGLYFNITFYLGSYNNYYIGYFIGSLILQIGYILYSKWLLNNSH